MSYVRLIVLTPLLLCISCKTLVEETVNLPVSFLDSATAYKLNRPRSQYRDKFYEADWGEYSVTNLDIQRKLKVEKSDTGTKIETNTLENILRRKRFNLEFLQTDDYLVKRHQSFTFDLANQESTRVAAQCNVYHLGVGQEVVRKSLLGKVRQTDNHESWRASHLVCLHKQKDDDWLFILSSKKDAGIEFTMEAGDKTYRVESVSSAHRVMKDMKGHLEVENSPEWERKNAGIRVFDDEQAVAAVSVVGWKNKIWVANNIDTDAREVLLSMGYGLILITWFDDQWRD